MRFGKLVGSKMELIPTANCGWIVKFSGELGEKGRFAFESTETMISGIQEFIKAPEQFLKIYK